MTWRRAAVALALLLTLARASALAQTLPALTAPVNDFANVIDATSEAELDRRIRALQTTSGDVIVVATVDTFAPYGSIEEYALKLFEQAGIGARSKDNGALVVLAVKDKRVRIEVGYGLEEFLTDGFAGETIREVMLPAFRRGDFGGGMLDGTTRVITRVADRRGVTLADVPRPTRDEQRDEPDFFTLIVIVIVILIVISRINRFRGGGLRRRGGWGGSTWSGWHGGVGGFGGGGFGGGGGGSFGGFGGGRSGGGGASGGW